MPDLKTPDNNSSLKEYQITVLLIDDQSIVAAAVERMLAGEHDITFHYCQDPTKAIQTAIDISPTVILQDLVMPDIDGLTLAKFIRGHSALRDIPLIVLSSKEEAVTKADAFAAGANDYLVKLPDKIELIARIRYHSKAYINLIQRNEAYDALYKSRQALAAELSRAADHVTSLLPAPLKEGRITTEWRFVPSAQLGGDSFGYHWIDTDHFAIYLLDVCDHGVGSALLSVSVLNALRSQTLPDTDFRKPGEVLSRLNDHFRMETQNNLYFTMWYGVFNDKTNDLAFASGGHPPCFVIGDSGETDSLATKNLLIGGLPGITFTSDVRKLETPCSLFVFSDGVYEVRQPDGSLWGLNRLSGFLREHHNAKDSAIDALYDHVTGLTDDGVLEDDFSILKVRIG